MPATAREPERRTSFQVHGIGVRASVEEEGGDGGAAVPGGEDEEGVMVGGVTAGVDKLGVFV